MIDNRELRIGNLVMDKISGQWMEVDEIGENVGATLINRDKFPLPDGWEMSPIPLTPEILEKAGFRNIQGYYYQKNNELLISLDSVWWWTNSWEPDAEFGFDALSQWKEIEYVHQLQNLYFCLTGEELKINL